jgi:hypothetical protein
MKGRCRQKVRHPCKNVWETSAKEKMMNLQHTEHKANASIIRNLVIHSPTQMRMSKTGKQTCTK